MHVDSIWFLAIFVFLLAGCIKGVVGIGLPTIVVGTMSMFIDPRQAIGMLVLPALLSNLWQVYRSKMFLPLIKKLWPFAISMSVCIWIFAQYSAKISESFLVICIGSMIVLFVLTNLFIKSMRFPDQWDRPVQISIGAVAGVMGGLTSIWAPPMLVYLMSRRMEKDEFVGAMGLLLFCGIFALFVGYYQSQLIDDQTALQSLFLLIPVLIGFMLGEKARQRLNTDQFYKVLLCVFFIMGANLIANGIRGLL